MGKIPSLRPGWGASGFGIQAATRTRQDPFSPAWSSRSATLPAHGGRPSGGCSLSPNIGFTNTTCRASGLSIGSFPLDWTRSGTCGLFRGWRRRKERTPGVRDPMMMR